MIKKLLRCCIFFFTIFQSSIVTAQAVNTQDSLVMVDLYNSTNGAGWINKTNWLTTEPLSNWYGIFLNGSGRVQLLILPNNNLTGTLPGSLSSLANNITVILSYNRISGTIPDFSNSISSGGIVLDHNLFTASLTSLTNYMAGTDVEFGNNLLNFNTLEPLAISNKNMVHLVYGPQADLPLHQNGNVLSVSAGGTLSKNTYQWYQDDLLIATVTGDSTLLVGSAGNYSVAVSNTAATGCVLYSISTTNPIDSLTLVDLYNNTSGPNWAINTNWLTSAPLSTWYGVTLRRGRVTALELPNNNLAGPLPPGITNLTNLLKLDLGINGLTGSIPSDIGALGSLNILNLEYNQLTGVIPNSIANCLNLTSLNLSSNHLSGSIPNGIGSLTNLIYLILSNNELNDSLPSSLGGLQNLLTLYLSNNKFTGSIPNSFGSFATLWQLELDNNLLTGSIPDSLFNNTLLNDLKLNNNQLTDTIPASLLKMKKLVVLWLNNNFLTGKLPDSLGAQNPLWSFDIHGNQLSGKIPTTLKGTSDYALFDIHDNRFTFDGMETMPYGLEINSYAPQANIPLNRNGNLFSVSAGGTLAKDTFRLYKNGILDSTKIGDSTFVINGPGKFQVSITNSIANQLTLWSNIDTVAGLLLAMNNTASSQELSSNTSLDILDNPYHNLILSINPGAAATAVNGNVDFKLTIDPVVQVLNSQPYVQRHFDINPANNASSATANVKLYFTQQDFDNFNAYPLHGLDLPKDPTDAAGIANLRIYQYHGFSTTSLPGSYSGAGLEINPDDANIVWNAAAQYWEVSFDVTGFSGFFVSNQNSSLLPVSLLSFTGKLINKNILLDWVTDREINTASFEIDRAVDGAHFYPVTKIKAAGNSSNTVSYHYLDVIGMDPVYYYKLKMIDKDGGYTFSNIIRVENPSVNGLLTIFPNPAKDFVIVNFPAAEQNTRIEFADLSGRVIRSMKVAAYTTRLQVDISGFAKGAYKITLYNGKSMLGKVLEVE